MNPSVCLTRRYRIRAQHQLPNLCEDPTRSGLHGHSFYVEISVCGPTDESGMIVDRSLMDQIVQENVIELLDKSLLNEHLELPTGEMLSHFIFDRLSHTPLKSLLSRVSIQETHKNRFSTISPYEIR